MILSTINNLYKQAVEYIRRSIYTKIYVPIKVCQIRRKKQIRVLFVLSDLSCWKTESLYNKMLEHSRFDPSLVVVDSLENPSLKAKLLDYLGGQGYNYKTLDTKDSIRKEYNPDIIFYQKPYEGIVDYSFSFRNNLYAVFCYVSYCFRNKMLPENQNNPFQRYAWQIYAENQLVKDELSAIMKNRARNVYVTGLPFMDDLIEGDKVENPWKKNGKKRIIYAPHHTICDSIELWSTFLEYGEFILSLAEKYKEETQWVFKPHPLLESKMCKLLGTQETKEYFEKWRSLENGQIEMGKYQGLFFNSNAMIHDCGSFMLEYLYTGNPVLFLVKNNNISEHFNSQTKCAFDLHYKAYTKEEIEHFVLNIIESKDSMKDLRSTFVKSSLIPPNGKSAIDNILNSILG